MNKLAITSERTLPPGSTSAELQEAINNADSGDAIILSGDMSFMDTVTLPSGKEITIQSDFGNNWVMSQPNFNTRHFSVLGTLILTNITLDGMYNDDVNGGGIYVSGGNLAINEGVFVQNCYTNSSGGAIYLLDSNFVMNGGSISGNKAASFGGGIYALNSELTMTEGAISNNTIESSGGGICLFNNSSFVMSGGMINNNTTISSGGGLYASSSSSIIIYKGIVRGNSSNYGGGIYLTNSSLDVDDCVISENTAIYGGGIYIRSSSYIEINSTANIHFSCNRAEVAHEPPTDAGELFPNILFASTTITHHPLNNYDINYMSGAIIDVSVHVIYDANGGVGHYTGLGIEPCDIDTVMTAEDTGIERYGYTFTSWNSVADGSGTSFAPGDEITVSVDITLFAQWEANLYKITYDANGGNGDYSVIAAYDSSYTVLSAKDVGISRMMYFLISWNTQSNGTGISYVKGDSFIINGDLTLYAQWEKITLNDAINLMLSSVAMKELAIAHILNTEAEKLQYAIGVQKGDITICDILALNDSMKETFKNVNKSEILLQYNLEDSLAL